MYKNTNAKPLELLNKKYFHETGLHHVNMQHEMGCLLRPPFTWPSASGQQLLAAQSFLVNTTHLTVLSTNRAYPLYLLVLPRSAITFMHTYPPHPPPLLLRLLIHSLGLQFPRCVQAAPGTRPPYCPNLHVALQWSPVGCQEGPVGSTCWPVTK